MLLKSSGLHWLGAAALALVAIIPATSPVAAQTAAVGKPAKQHVEHSPEAQDFVHGRPDAPTEAWLLAAGGRIYDNWWEALDRSKPEGTHPSYPAAGPQKGAGTWRCKECHGWDYKGRDGGYAKGSHATGIVGIDKAAGRDVAAITALLRAPVHGYTPAMINDEELGRVAAFVSRGQHDTSKFLDPATGTAKGDAGNGRAVFQTICAACHGYDGRLLNWGTPEQPAYVGTEAGKFPEEVLHKIRNSHPGAAMVSLRAMPLEAAVDVLTYARTLPAK